MTGSLNQWAANLSFSRALAMLAVANYLTLVVTNVLKLPVSFTLPVYAGAVLLAWTILRWSKSPAPVPAPPAGTWLLISLFLILLCAPRLLYLTEWLPDNAVLLQFDDYARVAELVSMTLSEQYPLRHPSSDAFLLSFYYSSLYPMAVLEQLLPILTLKDCMVIGSMLYYVLIAGSLVEFSQRLLPAGSRLLFLFLVTLFGGLDWILMPNNPWFGHDEWWAFPWFKGFYQISSSYTALFWTPHHYLGFYLPVVALLLYRQTETGNPMIRNASLALLLLAAAFSSPFAVLPLVLFLLPDVPSMVRACWRNPFVWLAGLSAFGPLYLFLERVQSGSFLWTPRQFGLLDQPLADTFASTLIYIAGLGSVDLIGLPFLLLLCWRSLSSRQRYYYCAATAFFVSTAFISYAGFNNYCMRGMLLVSFYYAWAGARYVPPLLAPYWQLVPGLLRHGTVAALVLLGSYGTLREAAAHSRLILINSQQWYLQRQQPLPSYLVPEYRTLARDASIKIFQPRGPAYFGLYKFNPEKFTETPVDKLERWELEIARRPLQAP